MYVWTVAPDRVCWRSALSNQRPTLSDKAQQFSWGNRYGTLSSSSHVSVHGTGEGPLFRFQDKRPLTRQRLLAAIRKVLAEAGLQPEQFAGHSFRIGAAACGVPIATIKTLGRWKSEAYQLYIRQSQLANISHTLASYRGP